MQVNCKNSGFHRNEKPKPKQMVSKKNVEIPGENAKPSAVYLLLVGIKDLLKKDWLLSSLAKYHVPITGKEDQKKHSSFHSADHVIFHHFSNSFCSIGDERRSE